MRDPVGGKGTGKHRPGRVAIKASGHRLMPEDHPTQGRGKDRRDGRCGTCPMQNRPRKHCPMRPHERLPDTSNQRGKAPTQMHQRSKHPDRRPTRQAREGNQRRHKPGAQVRVGIASRRIDETGRALHLAAIEAAQQFTDHQCGSQQRQAHGRPPDQAGAGEMPGQRLSPQERQLLDPQRKANGNHTHQQTDEDAQGNPAGHTGQFTPDLQVNLAIRRPAGRSTWRYTQSALNQLRTVTTTTATVSSIALGRVWAG